MSDELMYPINLIKDVMGADYVVRNTDDLLPSVEYAVARLNNDYEQDVIHYYYRDGLTIREIADVVDRCSQTVRNRLKKALRKLRHPSRNRYLRYGVEGVAAIELNRFADSVNRKLTSHLIIVEVNAETYNAMKLHGINTLEQVRDLGSDYFKNELHLDLYNMRILNNILVRYGLIEGEVQNIYE